MIDADTAVICLVVSMPNIRAITNDNTNQIKKSHRPIDFSCWMLRSLAK